MQAVANSSTAMQAVANSSTAMQAVANSSTAMQAVANSSTAMQILERAPIATLKSAAKQGGFYRNDYSTIHNGRALTLFIEEAGGPAEGYSYMITSPDYSVYKLYGTNVVTRIVKPMNSIQAKRSTGDTAGYSYIYYIPY